MAMTQFSQRLVHSRQASRGTAPIGRVLAPAPAPAAPGQRAVAAQAKQSNSDEQPTSVWLSTAGVKAAPLPDRTYPQVPSGAQDHYDVVVVGGGILGTTTAYMAKQAGKKVALIEARTIASGTTSFSTSKLSAQQGPVYSSISSQLGKQAARTYYDMNMQGIMLVEKLSKELKLDCEYSPRSHMMWCSDPNMMSQVQSEYEACLNIDIPDVRLVQADELTKELPKTLYPKLAVCFDNQAQFNSYKYVTQLAGHVKGGGCDVFEHSRVTSVTESGPLPSTRPHEIELAEVGAKLSADNVVLATGLPIMDRSLHFSILEPSRSPCIAFRVKKDGRSMRNMFVNMDMPMRSMRVTGKNDDIVVLSGEGYLIGEETNTDTKYASLEGWARQHFEVEEMVARWSAMDYYSADHVPFVGYLDVGTKSIFTGTGFSKWGLALGVASAALITDLIDGKENAFHSLVDARRWDLNGRLKGLAMEGAQTAKHLVGDKIKHNFMENTKIEMLQPGEGAVCKAGSKTVGAYRDHSGKFHVVEPVCTHLGCDVRFNQGDKCWDCPCHGSQFGVDGSVLHGPAVTPLPKVTDLNVQV